ncbi:uncharacterized protein METZ01_LOCUS58245, partial [marine metagenome]
VAKLADAQDLKSCGPYGPCGFDSHPRHFGFASGMASGTSSSGNWQYRVRDEECLSFVKMPAYESFSVGCPDANPS